MANKLSARHRSANKLSRYEQFKVETRKQINGTKLYVWVQMWESLVPKRFNNVVDLFEAIAAIEYQFQIVIRFK
jgi:hypothetical protein